MHARCSGALVLAVAGVLTMSCGIIDPSTNEVEAFSGTVEKGGISRGFAFTVSKTGEFSVKITALAPASSVAMGVAYAYALADNSCSASPQALQQTIARLNAPALTGQIFSGHYCVYVYDAGELTAAVTFTVTVSHP